MGELPSDGAISLIVDPTVDPTVELPADEEVTSFQTASGQVQQTPTHLFKNRFEIVRRLGKGGFGTTYLAHDISTSQPLPCVIKQLTYKLQPNLNQPNLNQPGLNQPGLNQSKPSLYSRTKVALDQERTKRRFQRETQMMARLGRHPQLPCLLDHFTDNNQFYLVQEHVPGDTLSREISRSGPKNEQQVKQFLREMIPVIRYIHRQNLLHLDIKPSNIMRRSSDQKLVLIDFGAVRRYPNLEGNSSKDRTTGTLGFTPSEQLAGQPTYASDIYALGVTCLYLLTQISPIDLATAERGQNLRWQESVKLSDHFTQILARMLHPEANRRYQNTDELERVLNLEDHYRDLKTCLNTEPLSDKTFASPAACPIFKTGEPGSQSQAQRQAESIRHWQQRRRQFKSFTPR